MAAKWMTGCPPLSLDGFIAAIATDPTISWSTHAFPHRGPNAVAVQFTKPASGVYTSPYVATDPAYVLSASLVASWCGTLGIDPATLGVDDR
jgi:hypothetical protein